MQVSEGSTPSCAIRSWPRAMGHTLGSKPGDARFDTGGVRERPPGHQSGSGIPVLKEAARVKAMAVAISIAAHRPSVAMPRASEA